MKRDLIVETNGTGDKVLLHTAHGRHAYFRRRDKCQMFIRVSISVRCIISLRCCLNAASHIPLYDTDIKTFTATRDDDARQV